LQSLLEELKAARPALNIEIVGINKVTAAFQNYQATAMRTLPWLQPTTSSVDPWVSWNSEWRDVVVLDSQNRVRNIYNLTGHSLDVPAYRETMRQMFLDAAQFVDTDNDQLHDDWELRHFGDLAATAAADPDGDGHPNQTEYAFSTDPKNAASAPRIRTSIVPKRQLPTFAVGFNRSSGNAFDFVVETSTDLIHWSGTSADVAIHRPLRNLFDGTGTSEAQHNLTQPLSILGSAFVRVRAVPRAFPNSVSLIP
jgi:hypothetical protein